VEVDRFATPPLREHHKRDKLMFFLKNCGNSIKYGMSHTNDILITSPFEKINLQVFEKFEVFKALAF
jgi:hypothetical protein